VNERKTRTREDNINTFSIPSLHTQFEAKFAWKTIFSSFCRNLYRLFGQRCLYT